MNNEQNNNNMQGYSVNPVNPGLGDNSSFMGNPTPTPEAQPAPMGFNTPGTPMEGTHEEVVPPMGEAAAPLEGAGAMNASENSGNTEIEGMTTAVINPDFMQEVETPVVNNPVVQEPIMQPPIVPAASQDNAPKKKKGPNKVVLIVIIVVIVLLLAIGGLVAFMFFGINPKKAQDKLIDTVFADAQKFANKLSLPNYQKDAKTMKSTTSLSFNSNTEEFSILNNYSLSLEYGLDKENNYGNINLSFLEKQNNLLDMNIYLLNSKVYLDSKDLYSKVITIGDTEFKVSDFFETLDVLNTEDLNHLLEVLRDSIKASFKEDNYERKIESVTLNGKKVNAFNNSYVMSNQDFIDMLKSILENIAKDDKALDSMTNMVNTILELASEDSDTYIGTMDKDEVKELLNSLVEELKNTDVKESNTKVYFNVYSNVVTNGVIGAKLYADDGKEKTELMEYSVDKDTSKFKIGTDESYISATTVKDKTTFELVADKEKILTGTLISTDTKAEITMTVDIPEDEYTEAGSVTISLVSETKNDTTDMDLKLVVTQGTKTYDLALKLSSKVTFDEKITKPTVTGAVPLESVDSNELSENLLAVLKDSELYDLIYDYVLGGTDYPDFDEPDYDFPGYEEIEYSEHCDEAVNCECDGEVCNCEYLLNGWKAQPIVCPDNNI